jgi:hypothetical protein
MTYNFYEYYLHSRRKRRRGFAMAEERKKINVISLVLGILATVFSVSIPGIAYSCGIPGIVIAVKRKNYNGKAGFALNVVAVTLAATNSVLSILLTAKMYRKARM